MRIVFIANTSKRGFYRTDPSYIYRCENLGLALRAAGHHVEFQHVQQLNIGVPYDIAVFHRPRASLRLLWLLMRLRRRGCVVLADFDDLVFLEGMATYSPAVLNHQQPLSKVRKRYAEHYRALGWFHAVTVSTWPLHSYVVSSYPQVHCEVIPNAIHYNWLELGAVSQVLLNGQQPLLISYLPGTRSHDRDFGLIAGELVRFLNAYPRVQLHVTGPLQWSGLSGNKQFFQHAKMPFHSFHECFQPIWVNLAPLEDTPFTRCKSALKVIEAAWWGKPTLCSMIPDAERLRNAGAIPLQYGQIYQQLSNLLDPVYYAAAVSGLRERIQSCANIQHSASHFLDWCDDVKT